MNGYPVPGENSEQIGFRYPFAPQLVEEYVLNNSFYVTFESTPYDVA